jgi:hypothetical protein
LKEDAHIRLKEALENRSVASLKVVPVSGWSNWLQVLLSIAAYETHPANRIVYLRGLQSGSQAGIDPDYQPGPVTTFMVSALQTPGFAIISPHRKIQPHPDVGFFPKGDVASERKRTRPK